MALYAIIRRTAGARAIPIGDTVVVREDPVAAG
jgi:hypothetical protein